MKNRKLAVLAIVAVCSLSLAGEAFARGGGQGVGMRLHKRDGSCLTNSTAAKTQTQSQSRQQLRDGSGMNSAGTGQGAMRRLGPGDGTGNATRPMDGTGYGSPAR